MARDWDATTYERLSQPIAQMGKDVLLRLELDGDETVLDAGCGTGKVTAALLERLPNGHVIAVDAAPSMVEEARQRLPDSVDVRQADLLELQVEPVDAILSTATFHWIADHDRLFANLLRALKPGGRLVANAVTLESEALLAQWYALIGGELTRIATSRAKAVGSFTGWQPAMPVTQWSVTKPRDPVEAPQPSHSS